MHALDVLGDPVRRRILELLADGEQSAGTIAVTIGDEFGISQPAVSQHLRVLREQGFAVVRPQGQRRLYAVDPSGPREASEWLSAFDRFWMPRLAALDTELARGRRRRRLDAEAAEHEAPQDPERDAEHGPEHDSEHDPEHDPDGGDRPVDPHPTKET